MRSRATRNSMSSMAMRVENFHASAPFSELGRSSDRRENYYI
jgi:hypothetical protein